MLSATISAYISDRLEDVSFSLKNELLHTLLQALDAEDVDVADGDQLKKCIGIYKNPLHAILAFEANDAQALMPQLPSVSKLALNTVVVKEQLYDLQDHGAKEASYMARTCLSLALRKYCPLNYSLEWISNYYEKNLGVPYEAATRSGTLKTAYKMTDARSEAIREFVYETSLWKMFDLSAALDYAKRMENAHVREHACMQQILQYMRCALYNLLLDEEESDILDTIEHKISKYGHKVLRYNRDFIPDSDQGAIRALNAPILVALHD